TNPKGAAMKRLIFVGYFLTIGSVFNLGADWSFPWLRTRPKPVVLEPAAPESAAKQAQAKRVEYHGTTTYTSSGRLRFPATSRSQEIAKRDSVAARLRKILH